MCAVAEKPRSRVKVLLSKRVLVVEPWDREAVMGRKCIAGSFHCANSLFERTYADDSHYALYFFSFFFFKKGPREVI